jgi:hypothetical protein
MDDLLFRVGVYRDSDQPAKTMDNERDAPDYINIRVDGGATGLLNIRRGMRLRIHGFLQSADFRESLEEFLEKANKYSGSAITVEVKDAKPNQVLTIRNTVEIVSKRIIVLDTNTERKSKLESTAV